MAFSSWRGVVGMVNPTMRPGMTEEVCRLLPEGIGLIPLFLNISRGTEDEFEKHDAALREADRGAGRAEAATSSIRTARRRSWCTASRARRRSSRPGRRNTKRRS